MESCLGLMAKSPMVSVLYVFALLAVVLVHGARASSFCQEVVEPLGYGCTEFAVETNDGFVLEMHRLSRVKSLVQSADRGSAPAVDKSPAYSRAPTNRGQIVSQYPQDHGLSPAVMLTPSDGTNSSINDSSSAAAHYIGSSPGQALKVPRNRSTDAQHSDSVNATHRSKRRHHHSQRSSPGSPEASRSSNRTSGNSSSQQPVVAASLAPTSTQNASSSSTQEQSQRTTDSGTPSNYTANPKAGKGSPVFLMHQEFFNGDTWFAFVDLENRTSSNLLPIMLLNDGFDVWIGHQRATYWSHGHVHLKPTDREYWDWTWDEHVKYDLPAQLLFISTETNQPVHFIGASQAATVGTAATTDHDIAMMIRSLTLIGPTAYRGYTSSLLLEAWAYFFGSAIDSGYYAMGYQNGAFNYSTAFPQTGPYAAQGLNTPAMALISGPNCCLGSVPIRFTNGWDGTTSFKNLLHWQQGIRSNNFSHYDYGNPVSNMQAYGRATPPAYNVEQIPSHLPILIIGGGRDWFAPPQGISLLLSQLQQQATLINLTNYAHYDLGFSARRETDMYLPILGFLEGL